MFSGDKLDEIQDDEKTLFKNDKYFNKKLISKV